MKLFGLFLIGANHAELTRYDGDRVYRISQASLNEVKAGTNIPVEEFTWREARFDGDHVDLHVKLGDIPVFESALEEKNLDYSIFIENIQSLIEANYEDVAEPYTTMDNFDYFEYHSFEDYQSWQTDFAEANSDIASITELGTSTEGRNINVLKLGVGSKKIILHGGTHAREWISPITIVNTAKTLVEKYRQGGADAKFLNDITWYLIINVNPDGYVYTSTTDRLWRKTRNTETPGSACVGVDTNRNWDTHWSEPGASDNPCSETYYGTAAFSEPETRLAAEHLDEIGANAYVDVHAYGQMLMYPYGYTMFNPTDWLALDTIVRDMALVIQIGGGVKFVTGTIASIVYVSSGGSVDYAYDSGVKCSFAAELRDKGTYGFLLPKNQIRPVAEEMFGAWTVLANNVINNSCPRR